MKILFYNYSMNAGGIERTIASLSREFVRRGHTVSLLQYTADKPFYPLETGVDYRPLGFDARGNVVFRVLKLYRAIRKTLRELRPDVIFCMNKTHLRIFRIASRRIPCALIGAERSNPLLDQSRRAVNLRRQSVCADGFVFQTDRARAVYPQKTAESGIVIPNAICNEDVLSAPFDQEPSHTFVSVGRLSRVKGYDLLIDAFSRISAEFPDWNLLIFGKGKEQDALQAQIDALGLGERATLAGENLHAYQTVKQCAVFVLSSRSEGMPNTLLEALSCGVACIAADCPNGPRELVRDRENGLLIPMENTQALADAMRTLAADPSLRKTLGKAAIAVRETHSMERIADRWLSYAEQTLLRVERSKA